MRICSESCDNWPRKRLNQFRELVANPEMHSSRAKRIDSRENTERSIERLREKLSHQIVRSDIRWQIPGRYSEVPTCVVTINAMNASVERVVGAIEKLLNDAARDLVEYVDMSPSHNDFGVVERQFRSDPLVLDGASETAIESFPAAAIHETIPAAVSFRGGVVRRLHDRLKDAIVGMAASDDSMHVSSRECRSYIELTVPERQPLTLE